MERLDDLEHRMEKMELMQQAHTEQNERIITLLDGPTISTLDLNAPLERDHSKGLIYIQREQAQTQERQAKDIHAINQTLANGVKTRIRLSPTVTASIIGAMATIIVAGISLIAGG